MTAPALPRATPEAMGVPPQAIAAFLDGVAAERLELHSLMVFHRGHVIAEGWWAPYRAGLPHMQHSLTKSFTATAIGLAVAEGRFALDDTVVSFFPEITAPGPHLAAMTIRHLLTMSTGHATGIGGDVWRQIRTSWTDAFFKAPVPEPPGARMVYSSASSYMLSAILQRTTGERLHAYLATRLFEPLGIEGESWDVCPNGINPGGNGLSCRTEDMLKLALLHLQRGRWDGRQILPEAWVSDALRPHLPAPFGPDAVHLGSPGAEWSRGYGYQWWTGPEGCAYAAGLFGQYAIVLPGQDAAIAITAATPTTDYRLLGLVWRHLLPAFGGLSRRLAGLRLDLPHPGPGAAPPGISGRWFRMDPNEDGVAAVMLQDEGDACVFVQRDARGQHSVRCGLTGWVDGATSMTGNALHHQYQPDSMHVVASARWLDPQTLEMTWVFVETAFRDRVICRFDDDRVTVERSVNVNTGALKRPALTGKQ